MIRLETDPHAPDVVLTPDAAAVVQQDCIERGDLLIWTITANTVDYPHQVAARPHSTLLRAPFRLVLLADSLAELRELLPPGLTLLARNPADDPVIVETWL
jgi:hypothetical protein